ncbi:MAG: dihydrofolate reductase [Fusobacteriaceae bacterium]
MDNKKRRPKLKIIVCVAEDNLIGDKTPTGNGLLWHSKEESHFYRDTTIGHVSLFGKSTANCAPIELMKKNRDVIILTRDTDVQEIIEDYIGTDKDIFICGGAVIYEYFLQNFFIDEILVSKLKNHVEVQTPHEPVYFPNIEEHGYFVSETKEFDDFTLYKYIKN